MAAQEPIRIALAGDAIITRKLSVYKEPEFLGMIDVIRSADAAFVNLEVLLHDYEHFPMHQSGGTYMRADPEMAAELKWAGFDMVSLANNHTGDYGPGGMRTTIRHVEAAGFLYAGAGESLTAAREAHFMETANGRIALISCASTFPDHSRAGKTRGAIPPRPGLNPIRFRTTYILPPDHFTRMQMAGVSLGLLDTVRETGSFRLFRQNFELGDSADIRTEPNQEDLEAIAGVVRNAARLADVVIVSVHAHERDGDLSIPAEFLVTFSRAMVDAGADIIAGHGPHVLRGIEIYQGKPILYSLGDFMFQNETLHRLPSENYERYELGPDQGLADFNAARYRNDTRGFPTRPEVWEGVIAMPEFDGETLTSLELHPISLQHGEPPAVRGRPMLADEELGKKIIEDLRRLSAPFGTSVVYQDGMGVVQIGASVRR